MGNGALVEKFTKCFMPTFRELILAQALQKYGHYNDVGRKRHKDDRYDLKELISVVTILVDDGTVPRERERSVEKEKVPGVIKVKAEPDTETEGRVANLQDGVVALGRELGSLRSFMQTMSNDFKTASQFVNASRSNGVSVGTATYPSQLSGVGATQINCYHCWELGHRTVDCEYLKKQVGEGKLIMLDGRPRLPSGELIPRNPPNVPPRDRVNTMTDPKAAAFYGWVEEPVEPTPVFATYVNQTEGDRNQELEKKIEVLQNLVSSLVTTRSGAKGEMAQKGQEGI